MATNAQAPLPTNAELQRLLEAVRAELVELKAGQQQLADAFAHTNRRAG